MTWLFLVQHYFVYSCSCCTYMFTYISAAGYRDVLSLLTLYKRCVRILFSYYEPFVCSLLARQNKLDDFSFACLGNFFFVFTSCCCCWVSARVVYVLCEHVVEPNFWPTKGITNAAFDANNKIGNLPKKSFAGDLTICRQCLYGNYFL